MSPTQPPAPQKGCTSPRRTEGRDVGWDRLSERWDVVVIGGGITGAGVLLGAARRGLRAVLLEAEDFASGTSSVSGKLVHGGMRYLRQARPDLTRALLRQRDLLLDERAGLVEPLHFTLPTLRTRRADRFRYAAAVRLYDLLRGRRATWRRLSAEEVTTDLPGIRHEGLDGGYRYMDAVTDDARLVLRTLQDAERLGALTMSRVKVETLVREGGRVVGVEASDTERGRSARLTAKVVVNAAGIWADGLRGTMGAPPRMRAIRGSHLVIPRDKLPIATAVGFTHPADGHYQYLLPWEGVTLLGTTNVDDAEWADGANRAAAEEVSYLLEGLAAWFPSVHVGRGDLIGVFSGLRPVVASERRDPYREGRDSVVWEEDGLLTAISGKLTGFQDIVARVLARLPEAPVRGGTPHPDSGAGHEQEGWREGGDGLATLPSAVRRRLQGRYGPEAPSLVHAARDGELDAIEGTSTLWAELRWGARAEGVTHLDDLLLRRTRLGMLLPRGGAAILGRVKEVCREELGWNDERWASELLRYRRAAAADVPVSDAGSSPRIGGL